MTLFKYVVEALEENAEMNNLKHWFEGMCSGEEAIDIYKNGFNEEVGEVEMKATIEALELMFEHDVDEMSHTSAQAAITTWNKTVWGTDFCNNCGSVPFGG